MQVNESYKRLREQALELNETGRQHCFCKGIDGGCCKPNITMLPEDQVVISDAVERGEISAETVQRAVRRAQDDSVTACAFLGDQGECTIYEHRPVLCIQHGNGGLPKEKATALRAMRKPGNKTIRVADLEQFSCNACGDLVSPNDRVPLSIVGRSVAILVTIQEGEKHYGRPRMNPFLIARFGSDTESKSADAIREHQMT